jgi:hypothetical protein
VFNVDAESIMQANACTHCLINGLSDVPTVTVKAGDEVCARFELLHTCSSVLSRASAKRQKASAGSAVAAPAWRDRAQETVSRVRRHVSALETVLRQVSVLLTVLLQGPVVRQEQVRQAQTLRASAAAPAPSARTRTSSRRISSRFRSPCRAA